MRVSAQAMCLYSQPTQARNPVRRGSPLNYHSVFNCERKDSRSQIYTYIHVYKVQSPYPNTAPYPAHRETYSMHTEVLVSELAVATLSKVSLVSASLQPIAHFSPYPSQSAYLSHQCPTHLSQLVTLALTLILNLNPNPVSCKCY